MFDFFYLNSFVFLFSPIFSLLCFVQSCINPSIPSLHKIDLTSVDLTDDLVEFFLSLDSNTTSGALFQIPISEIFPNVLLNSSQVAENNPPWLVGLINNNSTTFLDLVNAASNQPNGNEDLALFAELIGQAIVNDPMLLIGPIGDLVDENGLIVSIDMVILEFTSEVLIGEFFNVSLAIPNTSFTLFIPSAAADLSTLLDPDWWLSQGIDLSTIYLNFENVTETMELTYPVKVNLFHNTSSPHAISAFHTEVSASMVRNFLLSHSLSDFFGEYFVFFIL